MFQHFFPLILPIFVGQTPKYIAVCFETDCAPYYQSAIWGPNLISTHHV